MKTPLVSIIIPVYNTGKTAEKLLKKLMGDRYDNIEIIVVDDGSKDDSFEIIDKIAKKDKRLKLFHQSNSGQSSARNLGIKKAKGEYILFIDSDDDVSSDFISKLSESIQHPGVSLSVTGIHYNRIIQKTNVDKFITPVKPKHKKETTKSYILRLLFSDGRLYAVINKIFRADIIKNNNILFDETMNFAEDTKFVLDYLKYAGDKIEFILEPLYIYNYGTETSTVKESSLPWSNWQKSYDVLVKWVGNKPNRSEKANLKKVLLRWHISHALAVARSDKKYSQKTKYINPLMLLLSTIAIKTLRR